jgi:hypothetical protein
VVWNHGVSTHERELTEPVDLATSDGRALNPAALGWSRRPLHRANLRGSWGRNKRWDYWAVLAGDLVVSTVYADVDYLGLADVWWVDLATGHTGGAGVAVPLARGIDLPDVPGSAPLHIRRGRLDLTIRDEPGGTTRIAARWRERDGRHGALDAAVALPDGHESLNVVIPWGARRFQYTSKHQARPVTGTAEVGGVGYTLADAEGGAWGVLDVGRGRWPYRTRWNWGGGAGRVSPDGPVVGIQVGGRWTEGTGYTENGVLVDGRLTKIGDELSWRYDWDDPLQPWTVTDPAGHLDLRLAPRYDKHSKTDLGVLRTETHQVFGTWSGHVVDGDGRRVAIDGLQGFAEESRSRW